MSDKDWSGDFEPDELFGRAQSPPDGHGYERQQAAFVPPTPRGTLCGPSVDYDDEFNVPIFARAVFIEGKPPLRTDGAAAVTVEFVDPRYIGESLLARARGIAAHGVSVAKAILKRYTFSPVSDYSDPVELFNHAVEKYLSGERKYRKDHFLVDVASREPTKFVANRLFGNGKPDSHSVLTSLYDAALKRLERRREGGLDDHNAHPDGSAEDSLIERPAEISQDQAYASFARRARGKLHELVSATAAAGAFQPFANKAPEIYGLWCTQEYTGEQIASMTGVDIVHVYKMNDLKLGGYVDKQIKKYGQSLTILKEILWLSTPELRDYLDLYSDP